MIVCSLNEVEAYGRRAARGAGMSWGLAEEAGKAARWLSARGLPGVELLLRLLTANDGRPYACMAPAIDGGRWESPDGELCPVCCGAALSDRIAELVPGEELVLDAMAYPLLLAPFLDDPQGADNRSRGLRWPGLRMWLSARGVELEYEDASVLYSDHADEAVVSVDAKRRVSPTHHPRIAAVETRLPVWHALDDLGKRTYVPASEESRARGAGAWRTEND